jgi:hypothetical protein
VKDNHRIQVLMLQCGVVVYTMKIIFKAAQNLSAMTAFLRVIK